MSGSSICWAICKSAPRSRQTTTPAPHHSYVFYGPDALPAAEPTASKHWRLHATHTTKLGWELLDHRVGHFGPYGGTVRTMGWTVRYLGTKWCRNVRTLRTHLNSVKVSQWWSISGPKCLVTSPTGGDCPHGKNMRQHHIFATLVSDSDKLQQFNETSFTSLIQP